MQLPSAVTKAAKKSEVLQKQLKEGKPQDPAGTTPVNGTPPDNRDTLPLQVDPQTPAPNADTPQTPQPGEEETFKQKYLTLQGKYNAQVPGLQQEVRNLNQSMSELQEQIKESANQPQNPQDTVEGKDSQLDPEVFKEYGDDFGALIETIQGLQNQNQSLTDQVKKLSGDVTQTKESQEQKDNADYNVYMGQVREKLTALGSDFDALNTDPRFLNYLRQYSDNESESRFTKLQRAEAQRNVLTTMDIFKEYLGNKTPDPQPPPITPPNIQPPTTPTGADITPPQEQSTKQWTRAGIKEFYADKTAGKFKGNEEKATALEQDIFLAQKQGRILA